VLPTDDVVYVIDFINKREDTSPDLIVAGVTIDDICGTIRLQLGLVLDACDYDNAAEPSETCELDAQLSRIRATAYDDKCLV
jgi:hypothetical protein